MRNGFPVTPLSLRPAVTPLEAGVTPSPTDNPFNILTASVSAPLIVLRPIAATAIPPSSTGKKVSINPDMNFTRERFLDSQKS